MLGGLTIDIGWQVTLLDGWIEHLPRRASCVRRVNSVKTDIVEATVIGVREGRVYSFWTSGTDEPI